MTGKVIKKMKMYNGYKITGWLTNNVGDWPNYTEVFAELNKANEVWDQLVNSGDYQTLVMCEHANPLITEYK